jgi:hypothetical protein
MWDHEKRYLASLCGKNIINVLNLMDKHQHTTLYNTKHPGKISPPSI